MAEETTSPDDEASPHVLPRSPELMNAGDTAVLVVDVQERLLGAVQQSQRLVWNIRRLLDAAALLGLPKVATEQVPEKLGGTHSDLAERLDPPPSKVAFSCGECGEIFATWRSQQRHRVLLCGIETHVCVQQTAFDLLADGWQVFVAVDAVSSRNVHDKEIALRRMESSGVVLTTVEAALFEWCRVAGTPQFKQISALAKESAPTPA